MCWVLVARCEGHTWRTRGNTCRAGYTHPPALQAKEKDKKGGSLLKKLLGRKGKTAAAAGKAEDAAESQAAGGSETLSPCLARAALYVCGVKRDA